MRNQTMIQRTRYRSDRRNSRGAAMLLVLIAVAIATILALSFLASQGPTQAVAKNIDRKAKARQIAESALKMAIDYVNEDATWRTDKTSGQWITAAALDGGTFDLYGVDLDDGDLSDDSSEPVTIQVVATYEGVTHRVSAVVSPGGGAAGTNLLFVVGDSGSPSAQDQDKQALFENWGYAVTLLDDDATQAAFDAAVTLNDVMYISESVSGTSIGSKPVSAAIGIVNGEERLHDDFGLATVNAANADTTTTFNIVDNTHMITEGYSTGDLAIFSSAMEVRYNASSIASGVTTLAQRSSGGTEPTLMIVDAGGTLHSGTAAGRRVMVPFGSDFDVDELTTDGQTILWRCLQWAGGANSVPPMRIALYEFEEQAIDDPTLVGHWKLDELPDPGFGGIAGNTEVKIEGTSRIDSYDSTLGTYASQTPGNNAIVTLNSTSAAKFFVASTAYVGGDGYIGVGGTPASVFDIDGTLTGTQNVLTDNIQFPTLTAPTDLPASSGSYSRSSGVETISSDVTYDSLTLSGGRIRISGDVTMHVTGAVLISGSGEIDILDVSTLTMYTGSDFDVEGNGIVNDDTENPDKLTIYAYGNKHVDLKDNALMSAVLRTNNEAHFQGNSHFYGKAHAGTKIHLVGAHQFHQDLRLGGFPASTGPDLDAFIGISAGNDIEIKGTARVDSFDSTAGTYASQTPGNAAVFTLNSVAAAAFDVNDTAYVGGDVYVGAGGTPGTVIDVVASATLTGTQTTQSTNLAMPELIAPSFMPANEGNYQISSGSDVISGNRTFDKFEITSTGTVTISGNVTIWAEDDVKIKDTGRLIIPSGSSLTLYAGKEVFFENSAEVNADSTAASRLNIIAYTTERFEIKGTTEIAGRIWTDAEVKFKDDSHFYGRVLSTDKVKIEHRAQVHYDTAFGGLYSSGELDIAVDEVVPNNDGSYEGNPTGGETGFGDGGTAVNFDGDGDYVLIPNSGAYVLDEGTISLHHYPTKTTGVGPLFSKDATGQGNGGHVYIYRNGTRIAAKIETTSNDPYGTGATIWLQSSTGTVSGNTWNHVALTWGDGQVRLYADGVLVDSANHLGGLGTTSGGSGNAEPIVIGANQQDSVAGTAAPLESDFYEGRIDDVRIYDRPGDATQIANLAGGSDPGSRSAPGYKIPDTSGYGTAADMVIYDATAISWVGSGGLTFTGDTLASTIGAASKIHDAIEANGQFAVEIILTRMTAGATDRPSHIFSYVNTAADEHNFLIGQDDTNYEARVRDSDTGVTGVLSPELVSTTDLNDGSETHLVISYTAGQVQAFVDGVLDETISTVGTLNNWDAAMLLVLGAAYDDTDHFNGTVTRVAIYDRALNASQAENVYNGEEPGDGAGGTGEVDWDEED